MRFVPATSGERAIDHIVAAPDMKLQLIEAEMEFNGGGLKNLSPYVASLASLCIGGSYDIPTANISALSRHTRDIPGGSQRGFGGPEAFLGGAWAPLEAMAVAGIFAAVETSTEEPQTRRDVRQRSQD